MKQLLSLILIVTLFSCEKEKDEVKVPDYTPGRILIINYKGADDSDPYISFEYGDNYLIETYNAYYQPYTRKYIYNSNNQLESIIDGTDTSRFYYYSGRIKAIMRHHGDSIIFIKNLDGEISYSLSFYNGGQVDDSTLYEWNNGNLIREMVYPDLLFGGSEPIISEYEYDDKINPLFQFNLPIASGTIYFYDLNLRYSKSNVIKATYTNGTDITTYTAKYVYFSSGKPYQVDLNTYTVGSYVFEYEKIE